MNLFTSTPEREVIATVQFLPAVSIIMPFNPVLTLKKNLEYSLKNVMGKVEIMLTKHYTVEKAIPVIIKLRNLFSSLNYSTHKKSIAIFVSPIVEKVYYFGIEMEEKIVIDPSFTISNLVCCKKERKEYLVLLLSDTFSKMYLGTGAQLRLIKSNILTKVRSNEKRAIEKQDTSSEMQDQEGIMTNKFLLQMDQGLSIILKSYPLPVFIMGKKSVLDQFKRITKNDESLIQFIIGNYEETSPCELGCLMEHFVSSWKKLKQRHLLNKIENARKQNNLRSGIKETLNATLVNRGKLLIVENNMVNRHQTGATRDRFFRINSASNEFFIKNEVDDIIKNVFENGGDVEFIDDGLLKNYNGIVLIEDRQSIIANNLPIKYSFAYRSNIF